MSLQRKRILVAKPGLDGHDAGAKIIVLALRDAGAEVIYTGLRKTPEYIARVAIDEDVDAIGLSLLSGAHMELVTETIDWLKKLDGDEIKIFIGGTIPKEDQQALLDMGVVGVFTAEMKLRTSSGRSTKRCPNNQTCVMRSSSSSATSAGTGEPILREAGTLWPRPTRRFHDANRVRGTRLHQ